MDACSPRAQEATQEEHLSQVDRQEEEDRGKEGLLVTVLTGAAGAAGGEFLRLTVSGDGPGTAHGAGEAWWLVTGILGHGSKDGES